MKVFVNGKEESLSLTRKDSPENMAWDVICNNWDSDSFKTHDDGHTYITDIDTYKYWDNALYVQQLIINSIESLYDIDDYDLRMEVRDTLEWKASEAGLDGFTEESWKEYFITILKENGYNVTTWSDGSFSIEAIEEEQQ
jgi:hypothetical protein